MTPPNTPTLREMAEKLADEYFPTGPVCDALADSIEAFALEIEKRTLERAAEVETHRSYVKNAYYTMGVEDKEMAIHALARGTGEDKG